MRGIVLAGESGNRLWPVTQVLPKQLLPVYDKPLVHYPLTTLVQAGIREMLVITGPRTLPLFRGQLGDGGDLGLRIEYATQDEPRGIAEAFVIARDFLADGPGTLILGDALLAGGALTQNLRGIVRDGIDGGHIFASPVTNPSRYGVVEFGADDAVVSIEEKPFTPRSRHAMAGVYVFDKDAPRLAAALTPSTRGMLEITDLARAYLAEGRLSCHRLGHGGLWLDTYTTTDLIHAAEYVRVLQERQGLHLGCLEEAAWRAGFADRTRLRELAEARLPSPHADYLLGLLEAEDGD
jgi:glucose-1-phosphate thymidylyltransferase